jgi:hypothetical protein
MKHRKCQAMEPPAHSAAGGDANAAHATHSSDVFGDDDDNGVDGGGSERREPVESTTSLCGALEPALALAVGGAADAIRALLQAEDGVYSLGRGVVARALAALRDVAYTAAADAADAGRVTPVGGAVRIDRSTRSATRNDLWRAGRRSTAGAVTLVKPASKTASSRAGTSNVQLTGNPNADNATVSGDGGTRRALVTPLVGTSLAGVVTTAGIELLDCGALVDARDGVRTTRVTLGVRARLWLPFTASGVVANACGGGGGVQFVAAYGSNDCHVFTVDARGIATDRIVVHTGAEDAAVDVGGAGSGGGAGASAQRILNVQWLPSTRFALVVVMTNCVKVFDLSKDCIAPVLCYSVIDGTIVDATITTAPTGLPLSLVALSVSGKLYGVDVGSQLSVVSGGGVERRNANADGMYYLVDTMTLPTSVVQLRGRAGVSVHWLASARVLFVSWYSASNSAMCAAVRLEAAHALTVVDACLVAADSVRRTPLRDWIDVPTSPGVVCARSFAGELIAVHVAASVVSMHALATAGLGQAVAACAAPVPSPSIAAAVASASNNAPTSTATAAAKSSSTSGTDASGVPTGGVLVLHDGGALSVAFASPPPPLSASPSGGVTVSAAVAGTAGSNTTTTAETIAARNASGTTTAATAAATTPTTTTTAAAAATSAAGVPPPPPPPPPMPGRMSVKAYRAALYGAVPDAPRFGVRATLMCTADVVAQCAAGGAAECAVDRLAE